jgi:hypothetical protein
MSERPDIHIAAFEFVAGPIRTGATAKTSTRGLLARGGRGHHPSGCGAGCLGGDQPCAQARIERPRTLYGLAQNGLRDSAG